MPTELIVLIIVVVAGLALAGWYAAEQRRKRLAAWAAGAGLSFDPAKRHGLDNSFSEFDCLRQGHSRHAYNLITGRYRQRELLGFDYHYVTGSGKNRSTHHFSAVILASPVPLKPLFIRPEGLFDKVTEFFGHDDIDFESAEFSRRFYVKSPDRKWAYDVIHPRTIEFLLAGPVFTIKFSPAHVIAYRSRRFRPEEFASAAEVAAGILDRLPEYLVRQQAGTA